MDKRTLAGIDEAYLEQQVLGDAKELGWMAHHIRDSRRVLMGDPGFPDWVFARSGRIVIAELKAEAGELKGHQRSWLEALTGATAIRGGSTATVRALLSAPQEIDATVHLWTPTDWDSRAIRRVLT